MAVYQSGAFFQQCFSVHPLSLGVKVVTPPDLIGVVCLNCRMRHRLTLSQSAETAGAARENQLHGAEDVYACSTQHIEDLRVSSVDVVQDFVEIRCRPCRQTFRLKVRLFETHQAS